MGSGDQVRTWEDWILMMFCFLIWILIKLVCSLCKNASRCTLVIHIFSYMWYMWMKWMAERKISLLTPGNVVIKDTHGQGWVNRYSCVPPCHFGKSSNSYVTIKPRASSAIMETFPYSPPPSWYLAGHDQWYDTQSTQNIGLHLLVSRWNGRNIAVGLALRRTQGVFRDKLVRLAGWDGLQAAEHGAIANLDTVKGCSWNRDQGDFSVNCPPKNARQSSRG